MILGPTGKARSMHDPDVHRCRCDAWYYGDTPYCATCMAVDSRHRATHAARVARRPTFTGIDGEGVTRADGTHDYVLLSIGDQSLSRPDGGRLQWWEIFRFVYDYGSTHPDEILVGFFLGYDFTHWLRTLPEERARMLITEVGIAKRTRKVNGHHLPPFPVRSTDPDDVEWEYDMLPNRRFKLRPTGGKWVWVCDTGAFWQCSFLKAIDPKRWPEPICTPEKYATIKEGKDQRATATLNTNMIRYNVTENRVLSQLTGELAKAFQKSNIRLKRQQWFGPGQVASAWLKQQNTPSRELMRKITPMEVWNAAQATFYGGWFEIFAHGHVPEVSYEYDINSAYPDVIRRLPCLLHGRWRACDGRIDLPTTIVRARLHGTDRVVGCMPHRTSTGSILRPRHTGGWYWQHELDIAIAAGLIDDIDITEGWTYEADCNCDAPLAALSDLYRRRIVVGKNTPEGYALKLVYNSIYGKFAQSVGNPEWSNPIYASLVTSGCRSQILESIRTHPTGTADLLMVATDGVYYRRKHPYLEVDPEKLGAWDEGIKRNLTLFMPGLYWDDSTREKLAAGEEPKLKSRGVKGSYLAPHIDRIDQEFASFRYRGSSDKWPTVNLPIPFAMTTAKQALARGKWGTAGNVHTDTHWETCPDGCNQGNRTISSSPKAKRAIDDIAIVDGVARSQPHQWPRWADPTHPYEDSHPYKPADIGDDEITPDGDVMQDIRETILG